MLFSTSYHLFPFQTPILKIDLYFYLFIFFGINLSLKAQLHLKQDAPLRISRMLSTPAAAIAWERRPIDSWEAK